MKENISIEVLSKLNNDNEEHEMALSVLEGLTSSPKSLPSRLFYDDKGSQLFKEIMELEQYYPTRCEAEILEKHAGDITKLLDSEVNIVELGCGDGAKTILLLDELLKNKMKFQFNPLDISQAAVEFLIENLRNKYGQINFPLQGLVAEYFQGLKWLGENSKKRNLVLFLGSNIGNFNEAMAKRFMRHLWYSLKKGDYVLIGFDLKKDLDVLYYAYNDSKGITKEFNYNVLDRVNKVLGGNFKRENFQHQGLYNVQSGAMESYMISQKKHTVRFEELGKEFHFRPWEAIHMEYSYKYLAEEIEDFAASTGFKLVKNFTDSKGYFIDSLWQVV